MELYINVDKDVTANVVIAPHVFSSPMTLLSATLLYRRRPRSHDHNRVSASWLHHVKTVGDVIKTDTNVRLRRTPDAMVNHGLRSRADSAKGDPR
ncbi:hypothetical protein LSAT2_007917, partial [Lamellibrachia satsuma]